MGTINVKIIHALQARRKKAKESVIILESFN